MKTLLSAAVLSFSMAAPALPVAAQDMASGQIAEVDPDRLAVATQIIDIGIPDSGREAMFFATIDQMIAQMNVATASLISDPGANAIIKKNQDEMIVDMKATLRKHIPNLMDAWAKSYASIFTLEELNDILDFVSTPSGQRFFTLSPALMAEPNFANANQAYMNEIMIKLPDMQLKLQRELKEYMLQQMDASPPPQS